MIKLQFRHGPLDGRVRSLSTIRFKLLKRHRSLVMPSVEYGQQTFRKWVYVYVEPDVLLFAGEHRENHIARVKRGDVNDPIPATGHFQSRSKWYGFPVRLWMFG